MRLIGTGARSARRWAAEYATYAAMSVNIISVRQDHGTAASSLLRRNVSRHAEGHRSDSTKKTDR